MPIFPLADRRNLVLLGCRLITEVSMKRRHLRIFTEHTSDTLTAASPPATNAISLRDLLPLVAMAQRLNMVWLRDFLDDEVIVTNDLYEVLQAFKSCRPSA